MNKDNKVGIKWARIAKPKDEGGLGIKGLSDVMVALHAKLVWYIHTKGSLFSSSMANYYIDDTTIKKAGKLSPLWKSLLPNCDRISTNTDKQGHRYIWMPVPNGKFSTNSALRNMRNSAGVWILATNI